MIKTKSAISGIAPETWGWFRLLEKLMHQARRDAKRGDISAIAFLDMVCPAWRTQQRKL